ncbi:EamA family transporter [Patescibacteria group bacterium]|nr:EamA family transporter [Patescibacteria group bacterium]
MSWLIFAFMSALFAALTAILAKVGVANINSNLATAIRTVVITVFSWSIVLFSGEFHGLNSLSKHSVFFLILSGLTTGISWLFYFRALQLGNVSKVVPIDRLSLVLVVVFGALFLSEKVTLNVIIGSVLMATGAILIAF